MGKATNLYSNFLQASHPINMFIKDQRRVAANSSLISNNIILLHLWQQLELKFAGKRKQNQMDWDNNW